MDDRHTFERRLAAGLDQLAGPRRPVDAIAISRGVIARSGSWRFQSLSSATKLLAAGFVMTLLGGLLLAGLLPPSSDRAAAPGAAVDGRPSLSDSAIQSPSPKVAMEVYEATARLYVDPGPEPSEQHVDLAKLAAVRYAELAMSRPIAAAIVDDLDLGASPASVQERIRAEADEASLEVVIRARDEDPSDAQRLAISAGTRLRQWVRDELVTDDDAAVTEDIRQTESLIRTLERRLENLLRKSPKDFQDRAEIISLTGQLSTLRQDIQFLRESSRASVRNLLEWLERPLLPTQPVMTAAPERSAPDPASEAVIPTRSLVVAVRRIEQGTTIEREMLTLRSVPMDASNDMAITDIGTALGRVPAIDILENQIVTPNMLEAQ
ncbi:MAG: SAF domain-containing protein [Chloroflexota bacterium]|jgi:hypothetical protein